MYIHWIIVNFYDLLLTFCGIYNTRYFLNWLGYNWRNKHFQRLWSISRIKMLFKNCEKRSFSKVVNNYPFNIISLLIKTIQSLNSKLLKKQLLFTLFMKKFFSNMKCNMTLSYIFLDLDHVRNYDKNITTSHIKLVFY